MKKNFHRQHLVINAYFRYLTDELCPIYQTHTSCMANAADKQCEVCPLVANLR